MNYKGVYQNQNNAKKIVIIAISILVALLFVLMIALNYIKTQNEKKDQAVLTGNFNSIKDIVEYYDCTYKKEKNSTEENFNLDIYLIFKYDLFEDEKSNEEFYNKIINKIAEFLNYSNFRLIDESREEEIEIRVVCNKNSIEKIYINGKEDYFIYMASLIDLSKYEEIQEINIEEDAEELKNCIANGWNSNVEFGSRETIFQDYYIYFDEGIKARTINGKIYNIIFTKNYTNPVVNGLTVGMKNDAVIRKLGTPAFQNDDETLIGYKGNKFYVFFEEGEISIYRNIEEEGFDEFFNLVDDFLNDEYTLLEFMNELTYIWPDYDEYAYDTNTVFLSYPNKGVDVKINYDDISGIVLYNNIGISQDTVQQYLENTEFISMLQIDNVYNAEIRRFDLESSLNEKCDEYEKTYEQGENEENLDDKNKGEIYKYYAKLDSSDNIMAMYFVSQNKDYANCELIDAISTYIWINDYCFVYSKKGSGIYYYDLKTQTKGTLITGDDEFSISSYKNSILSYDDKEIQIQY